MEKQARFQMRKLSRAALETAHSGVLLKGEHYIVVKEHDIGQQHAGTDLFTLQRNDPGFWIWWHLSADQVLDYIREGRTAANK